MVVGICKLSLIIYSSYSLKDKRRTIKSILEMTKSRFKVSSAEVDDHEIWNKSVIGVSCVANDALQAESIISSVIDFIENDSRVNVIDIDREVIRF